MPVLRSFLERLGFVRLRDYGLILTQDRRVVTTRQILDDGYGATVVGWAGGDLAMMELATKDGSEPAPAPIPEPPPVPLAMVFAPPTPPVVVAAAPAPAPVVVAAPPPPVVAPNDEPEDEWEWEIAAARARACAADVFERPARTPKATPAPPWREDTAVRSVTQLAKMSEQVHSGGGAPRTIIPVPQLPVAKSADEVTRQLPLPSPVVRRYRNAS